MTTLAATARDTALAPADAAMPEDRRDARLRLAMAVAVLSVVFEKVLELDTNLALGRYHFVAATGLLLAAAGLTLSARWSRGGIALAGICIAFFVAELWAGYHNHGWLSLWTIPVAAAFGTEWWRSEVYRWYLRVTLGVVMLAACAQKLLAGTYLDGSYIAFLSQFGSTTERMFGFLCGPAAEEGACAAHKAIGTFIVVWQAAVGVLLIAGVRNLAFLFIEIAFLLGAGLFADEMNFQVLNIALLCVGFGYGMPLWLLGVCGTLLVVDAYSIAELVAHVL